MGIHEISIWTADRPSCLAIVARSGRAKPQSQVVLGVMVNAATYRRAWDGHKSMVVRCPVVATDERASEIGGLALRFQTRSGHLGRDPGGEPLDRLIGPPMDVGRFLRTRYRLSPSTWPTARRPISLSIPQPARFG
jgi:hypothetical protein